MQRSPALDKNSALVLAGTTRLNYLRVIWRPTRSFLRAGRLIITKSLCQDLPAAQVISFQTFRLRPHTDSFGMTASSRREESVFKDALGQARRSLLKLAIAAETSVRSFSS